MRNPFSRTQAGRPFERAPRAEVNDELAYHLERRVADFVARGMTPEAARAAALERFGDVGGVERECTELLEENRRSARRRDWIGDLRQDVTYGARALRRAPLFTLAAVVTLALGIGANAAVFGVVKSVLLDALPYADAGRLMHVYGRWHDGTNDRGPLSAATVVDLRARSRSFERIAVFEGIPRDAVYSDEDAPRSVRSAWVEPELFRTLGVPMVRGRALRDEDARGDTMWNVLVTHAAWQSLAGGAPDIVGRRMVVNGVPRTVVGVLPRDFVGPVGEVEFYFPMSLAPALRDPERARRRQFLVGIARLRPGVTPEAAQRELLAIGADLSREFPESNARSTIVGIPEREALMGDTRTPLLVLLASAGLVLLITCANLTGALLSRTISRRKEFAVRVALGAGRGRIVRQLLTESTLLAAAGGACGLLLAIVGLRIARGLAAGTLPPYADLSLDRGALLVTAAVTIATGLAVGLVPALSVSRTDVQGTLRDEGRGASETRRARHLRGLLVAGQIALCVSLLAGAGLLARSLWALMAAPLGMAPSGVLAVTVQLPPGARYNAGEARARFVEQVEERLRSLPGVTGVASAGDVPSRVLNRNGYIVDGAPPPSDGALPWALYQTVSDDYFRTLRIPLRRGRAFGRQDHAESPLVVVVNESLARRHWPAGDAIGKRLRLGPADGPWYEVVGVVGDVVNDAARLAPDPATYVPVRQAPWNGPIFLVRTSDLATIGAGVRRTLAEVDPSVPLRDLSPLPALLADGFAHLRLPVVLMTAFGALALVLASVGVYALFASMAAAREREFGVRVALGSTPARIATLVLRQGGTWMALGLAGGALGIVAVARLLRGLLYGVAPFDPATLAIAVLLLLACAVVALLGPVRRATRVDPITVLR